MTASFSLALDTRAPVLTWGPVQDANAGEILSVAYVVDEPGVKSATITLRDGRSLPMTVGAAALTVLLPDDATDGQATVSATTRDAVWNERTFTLGVLISGTPLEPPPPVTAPPPTGMPQPEPVVVVSAPSRCGARTSYRTTGVVASRSTARTRSRYAAPGFRQKYGIYRTLRVGSPPDELLVAVSSRTRGKLHSDGAPTVSSANAVVKRPEGPNAEDELFLLGLL